LPNLWRVFFYAKKEQFANTLFSYAVREK